VQIRGPARLGRNVLARASRNKDRPSPSRRSSLHVGRSFLVALICLLGLIQTNCDRPSQSNPLPKEPSWLPESIDLSLDAILASAIAQEKKEVEEAHKSGHRNVVGARDGKWWLDSSLLARIAYINAVGDLVGALGDIHGITGAEVDRQRESKGLDYAFAGDSFHGPVEAESMFSGRIQQVIGGRSFGDLADQVLPEQAPPKGSARLVGHSWSALPGIAGDETTREEENQRPRKGTDDKEDAMTNRTLRKRSIALADTVDPRGPKSK
jgi:hypothetical protein